MIFDLVVVIVVLLGVLLGAWKGLAWQLAGIASLVAGFVVAIPLSAPLATFFGQGAPLNRFIALGVIYGLVSLGIYLVALFYRQTIQKWQLDRWDRHLGAVMGGVKGFLFCVMVVFFSVTLLRGLREPILTTRTGKLIGQFMTAIHPVWPPEVHDIVHPYVHHLDKHHPPAAPAPSPAPAPVAPKPDTHHHP